jgi:hypothetical protein
MTNAYVDISISEVKEYLRTISFAHGKEHDPLDLERISVELNSNEEALPTFGSSFSSKAKVNVEAFTAPASAPQLTGAASPVTAHPRHPHQTQALPTAA